MSCVSQYTLEVGKKICVIISRGKSLTEAAKEVGIARTTVTDWILDHEEFSLIYAKARTACYEVWADEVRTLSDADRISEIIERCAARGEKITTRDAVERSKLMVDSRKWLLCKLVPHKYGEKLETKTTLEAGDTLLKFLASQRDAQ